MQAGAVQGLASMLTRAASPSALSAQQADQDALLSTKALSAIVKAHPASGLSLLCLAVHVFVLSRPLLASCCALLC